MNNTILHSETSGEIVLTNIVPIALSIYALQDTVPIAASGPFGDFLFQTIGSQEIDLWYNNYLLTKDDSFTGTNEEPRLEMQFALSNTFKYNGEGIGDREMHDGSFNMVFVPFVKNETSMKLGRIYTTFDIRFNLAFLIRMTHYFPILSSFLEKVNRNESAVLCEFNQVTSIQMKNIIYDILNNPYTGTLLEFYIDTKVMEMMIVSMEQVALHPAIKGDYFHEDDIEKIYAAKDELLEHLDRPITLLVLSRKVGLNVHKLKTGFQQFYGSSVAIYLLDARMKVAKELLIDTEDSVENVAFATGYVNVQHFSKAFKKYYKFTPAQYRKAG